MSVKRIGVLTGGGDAPGLNPAIRALVWKAAEIGVEAVGIYDGWRGMMDGGDEPLALDVQKVRYWDLAGGAYITLIPEAPFAIDKVLKLLDERLSRGKKDRRLPRYAVVVVAEGALPSGGGEVTVEQKVDAFGHARLGGIGAWLSEQIRVKTSWDSRAVALGHPQRGGTPSPIDRIMGHLFGSAAVEACIKGAW